ncbi:putative RNA polymerase II subunit B1 CTD phosphatase RPAP2 isoform X1 [Tympanuchus pallidicinctus]|uniref:putative RNA polymerase II subunit B1 CTD phosphatase RPAP2 isoform X1 n=1 Tax=Tympanuchus pallidicinctus TaxID=109042 RepID=UPI00228714E3|nr:putative RNA polymerase II subunit B1 CTD phosphatase RPAP2 isoform X1 [Tympanuchus pallidicinctus]
MADGKPQGSSKGRPGRRRAGNKRSAAPKNEDAAQRKAALEASTRKKIELEKKALHIVEQLLEENITEEFLLNSGKCITPSHYKDIVDERSIIKLCGYPVCRNKLENVPKQKYRISTKTNRVYDITERKCFCSNFCYKASKYFEAQISKSPVWMREEEIPSDIELLKRGQSGQSGEEVKLCDEVIKSSDIENPRVSSNPCESASYGTASDSSSDTEQEFVSSVLPGSQSSSVNLAQQLHRNSILKKKHVQKVYSSSKSEGSDVVEITERLSNCKLNAQEEMHACTVQEKITAMPSKNTTLGKSNASENCEDTCSNSQIVFLGVSKKGAEYLKTLANSKQHEKIELRDSVSSSAAKCSLLELLKQTLTEWRTEETLRFLYGPNYTLWSSECLSSANQEDEELDEDDLDTPEDLDSAAVGKFENSLNYSLPFMGSGETVKPVPSYEELKEETEFLQLRVREFYKGKYILAEEELAHTQADEHSSTDKNDQQEDLMFPLVDSNAQMQIRKRIVLEKLRRALPAVLGPLQIMLGDVYTELKNLVKTFRLTNTNIIHKMPEWTLIAIVLLSVLSQNIPVFKDTQRSPAYTQFLTTLLEELHFKNEDLESLTRIFRANSPPEWSVNFKLFCIS